ncbi:LCP family glycopolymer transferase [Microbacterium album]|uniref:Transcriptional regulator n=1 Tax=Microbacterium album TaxID=2053191 RepID=A0A917IFI5_9MICO|nr:LCP family protein [Microbacterium album]GGH45230.1 transcriptional regulator [Microbacterium album]
MSETSKRRGRRPIARHGQLSAPRPFARIMRTLGIAMSVVLVAGLGVAAYIANDFWSAFTADAVELEGQATNPPDIGALDENGVNILLTGIDVCEWDFREVFGAGRCPVDRSRYDDNGREITGALNDVNMLVHVSPEPRRITVVTFPRDLMIPTPECTDPDTGAVTPAQWKAQINNTFQWGGLPCVAKTIDTLTVPELKIEYAANVTWGGVIDITNAIGGVEVCVENAIRDRHTGLNLGPGPHTLVGVDALQFLRTRHGVGDGGDLARIGNQQVYMAALARKLTSEEVLTNISTVLTLARTVLNNVDPSSSLNDPVTLAQIAMAANDVPLSDIAFVQYPVLEDPSDRYRVVPNEAAAEELWAKIVANEPLFAPEPEEPPAGGEQPGTEDPGTGEDPAPEQPTTPVPEMTQTPPPGIEAGRTARDESCSQGSTRVF